jgi:hypothetical protein
METIKSIDAGVPWGYMKQQDNMHDPRVEEI